MPWQEVPINHRESIDIDLFCLGIIGYKGFYKIEEEVKHVYGNHAFGFIDPANINDQFTFLRFFIRQGPETDEKATGHPSRRRWVTLVADPGPHDQKGVIKINNFPICGE
ncbi:hypothetical protein [Sinomicrobium soli]|uniref:hypothetical protein n=1 Tax=Sinomicrobium sp. N-1-3-6 TaxID=2219864 RepID=UPI000DCDD3FD|nr:hypothetical protein [Sinomicrobium sp. N-1-3-6]RAV28619.1 hypothetical protein DN748_11710 [Sinomicrobium sp. N-1-3-6]